MPYTKASARDDFAGALITIVVGPMLLFVSLVLFVSVFLLAGIIFVFQQGIRFYSEKFL